MPTLGRWLNYTSLIRDNLHYCIALKYITIYIPNHNLPCLIVIVFIYVIYHHVFYFWKNWLFEHCFDRKLLVSNRRKTLRLLHNNIILWNIFAAVQHTLDSQLVRLLEICEPVSEFFIYVRQVGCYK